MSNTTKPLTVFLDNVGRTIIGRVSAENENVLSVENPALVHIQTNAQTNQLHLQILPLFFKEFLANRESPTVWDYRKGSITPSNQIVFADQFIAQYEQVFQPAVQAPPKEPKVVKLFDD